MINKCLIKVLQPTRDVSIRELRTDFISFSDCVSSFSFTCLLFVCVSPRSSCYRTRGNVLLVQWFLIGCVNDSLLSMAIGLAFFPTSTARLMLTEWWLINCSSLSLFSYRFSFTSLFVTNLRQPRWATDINEWVTLPLDQ